MLKNHSILIRAKYSLAGIRHAWKTERSFRDQQLGAALALVVALAIWPPALWWAVLVLAIALSTAAELLNAAIEAALDIAHPGSDPMVGRAKDIASGGAFVCNCTMGIVVLIMVATQF